VRAARRGFNLSAQVSLKFGLRGRIVYRCGGALASNGTRPAVSKTVSGTIMKTVSGTIMSCHGIRYDYGLVSTLRKLSNHKIIKYFICSVTRPNDRS